MSCPTCNTNNPTIVGGISSILATINSPCNSSLCPTPSDSKCTFYSAGNLTCSGIITGDSLEIALQKIDTLLCASAANYSTYNTYCLAPITTQKQFVEAISQYVCNLNTSLVAFTGTTFTAYQTTVSNQIAALAVPGTTSNCSSLLSIVNTDTLQSVLQKLSNGICTVYGTALNLSSVNWNQCNTVSPTPTTIAQGFNALITQICALQASGGSGALPVFNNVGSCLPAPLTASDTLVSTVNKIKTRLCQAPIFDINALSWNCVSKPSTTTTDLQSAIGALLAKLDVLSQNASTFSSDFTVTATDPVAPCLGKTISLSTSIADRKVAATPTDNIPGTLQDKIFAGTGITLDFTNPTRVTINSSSTGGPSDGKVKTDSLDPTADYLSTKIVTGGVTNGIAIVPTLDGAGHLIKLINTVDPIALFSALLTAASTDPTLKAQFCSLVASCPSPCAAPGNISVVYGGTTSSTTTTTTTGAPTTSTTSTTTTSTTAVPITTTTTTSTSTTSTSSTTTTTTTVLLSTIYVGAQSSATPPTGAAILSGGTTSSQNGAVDVNANWVPFNATPQYCWIAIPNLGGTYTKTKWYVDVINNGNIGGPSDLFFAPSAVTVGGNPYFLYFTQYQTQFTANCLMQA